MVRVVKLKADCSPTPVYRKYRLNQYRRLETVLRPSEEVQKPDCGRRTSSVVTKFGPQAESIIASSDPSGVIPAKLLTNSQYLLHFPFSNLWFKPDSFSTSGTLIGPSSSPVVPDLAPSLQSVSSGSLCRDCRRGGLRRDVAEGENTAH